jgi:hypothetical protein
VTDPKGDAAFRHLEELVASAEKPVKKKRVLTPEQRERHRERDRERKRSKSMVPEQRELHRKRALEWYKNMPPERLEQYRERRRVASLFANERAGVAVDPELFAINQAILYAAICRVSRDITAACPEPMRSRLQALIDTIKADPAAGKPLTALLYRMREVRKLELAEQQLQAETPSDHHQEEEA